MLHTLLTYALPVGLDAETIDLQTLDTYSAYVPHRAVGTSASSQNTIRVLRRCTVIDIGII